MLICTQNILHRVCTISIIHRLVQNFVYLLQLHHCQARSQDCQNKEADRSSAPSPPPFPSPPLPSPPIPFSSLPSP